jgi:hypothetical protein
MYEHSFKTLVGNGDHIYGERGNCSWNGMLFSSKKALLLNFFLILGGDSLLLEKHSKTTLFGVETYCTI